MIRTDALDTDAAGHAALALARPLDHHRRIYRLGRHWALAVNRKILCALGLAAVAWACVAALIAAVIP